MWRDPEPSSAGVGATAARSSRSAKLPNRLRRGPPGRAAVNGSSRPFDAHGCAGSSAETLRCSSGTQLPAGTSSSADGAWALPSPGVRASSGRAVRSGRRPTAEREIAFAAAARGGDRLGWSAERPLRREGWRTWVLTSARPGAGADASGRPAAPGPGRRDAAAARRLGVGAQRLSEPAAGTAGVFREVDRRRQAPRGPGRLPGTGPLANRRRGVRLPRRRRSLRLPSSREKPGGLLPDLAGTGCRGVRSK